MSRFHVLTGEHSRLRNWALYIFARYVEMPLLGWSYRLLRGRYRRLGQNGLVRAILGWGLAAPFGYLGDTARPMPVLEVLRLIAELDGPIAVGPCRCRTTHDGCNHPLETDIVIRTGVAAWRRAFPRDYRLINKTEAAQIINDCRRQGLWQMVFVHCPVNQANEYVICNCCACGCVPYILNRELGQRRYPLLRGDYVARLHPDRCASSQDCNGSGDCVRACPFEALALSEGKAKMVGPCFGCGQCAAACPQGAIDYVYQPA